MRIDFVSVFERERERPDLDFSSVEHQINDMKQRLEHFQEKTREHEEIYEEFQKQFQSYRTDLIDLRGRVQMELADLTLDQFDQIEVSDAMNQL